MLTVRTAHLGAMAVDLAQLSGRVARQGPRHPRAACNSMVIRTALRGMSCSGCGQKAVDRVSLQTLQKFGTG